MSYQDRAILRAENLFPRCMCTLPCPLEGCTSCKMYTEAPRLGAEHIVKRIFWHTPKLGVCQKVLFTMCSCSMKFCEHVSYADPGCNLPPSMLRPEARSRLPAQRVRCCCRRYDDVEEFLQRTMPRAGESAVSLPGGGSHRFLRT